MARRRGDAKVDALREHGCLNAHPERVADEHFAAGAFFDPRDLVQVKYEMVRRIRVDGTPLAHAARDFGFSRVSAYAAQAAVDRGGIQGLVPRRPGPRGGHKLTEHVLTDCERALDRDASLRPKDLVARVAARFGVQVHPRSIERALARRQEKKRR